MSAVLVPIGGERYHAAFRPTCDRPRPDQLISATPFEFVSYGSGILREKAKPVFADIEPNTANIDPNLIEDTIISRCVIRVGVDEPTPERQSAVRQSSECQSAVRGNVMRRLRVQRRRGSGFTAIGLGDGGQDARGCRQYFAPIHLQPFCRTEFGFKEGDSPVTGFADFAESAGHTSIAIPLRYRLRAPGRRGNRLRRRRPRACAGGGAVGSASTPSRQRSLPPPSPGWGQRSAEVCYLSRITCRFGRRPFSLPSGSHPSGARVFSFFETRPPRRLRQSGMTAVCSIRRLQVHSSVCEALECRNERWHLRRGAVTSMSADAGIGVLDVARVRVASCIQGPAARTSNVSRHPAGSTGTLSKLSIGYAWIAFPVLSIPGGWPNVSSRDQEIAACEVAKTTTHLPQHLSTFILPATTPEDRQRLRTGTQRVYCWRVIGSPFCAALARVWRPVSASMLSAPADGLDMGSITMPCSRSRGEGG